MENKYSVCMATVPNYALAAEIAESLVEKKLAACVNLLTNIKSVYRWQGKVEKSEEVILLIKTRSKLVRDVIQAVKEKHTYSVPEVIFYDISEGNEDYLDWIGANTLFSSNIPADEDKGKNK
ncbi:MAG: divalent-cation tolerance protein CutA [Elusimicrobiota bacterium]